LKTAQDLGIESIVASRPDSYRELSGPAIPSSSQAPDHDYNVEHPFGTMKRQWGFSYILTKKGTERASVDVGFMFFAYNLRRIGNILTMNRLKEYLRILVSLFLTISAFFRRKISRFVTLVFQGIIYQWQIQPSLKSL
jgi:hypothetical protein